MRFVVDLSVRHRVLVFLAVALYVALGVRAFGELPIDAVPDVTNVQVQVLTSSPGLSPLEVEALVTRPVELSLMGLPRSQSIRSVSRSGVSAVTVVFEDDTDLGEARSLVSQRLPAARAALVRGAKPEMGPMSTGLGEVFHFTVSWPGHTPAEIRTLLDWEIGLALRTVPGVVEVNGWGGDTRQVEVRVRTPDLAAHGVTLGQVERALTSGGESAGGGALERGQEQLMVRLDGQYRSADAVAHQVIATRPGGAPLLVKDVADVRDGVGFRLAAATRDGKGETVYAMVQMIAGGNAHDVVSRVKAKLVEIDKTLPPGAHVEPVYDRASLVDRVLSTVKRSLAEGGLVVVIVLFLMLGDAPAGLVVATVIPLSMLGAFALMRVFGITGNLMSLGAIDFGLIVDGAVVVVEGALATMAVRKARARDALVHEAETAGRPIAFGVLIVAIVYVPVLLLDGVEGKMFRPMAMTVLFAILTALVLTFTWVPALASVALRRAPAREPVLVRALRRLYAPVLDWTVGRPGVAAAAAAALVAAGVAVGATRGAEFVPRLEEGDLVVQITRPPSVSLREAVSGTTTAERTLAAFPEVVATVSRTGSPDVATDIMGVEQTDLFVFLRPPGEWKTARTREALVEHLDEALRRELPGAAFAFTQPIEMRTQELLGGSKSDVGVKIYGADLRVLAELAGAVAREIGKVDGAADVRMEQLSGLPVLTVRPDPWRAGRAGVGAEELRAAVETIRAGRVVGTLVETDRRFDVVLRGDAATSVGGLGSAPLVIEGGKVVDLASVADVRAEDSPVVVSHERGRRRVLVEANVRGRDLASFVGELERRIRAVPTPPGYSTEITGQYEHLVHAARRFAFIVPVTLVVIFVLLYLSFGRVRPALLILINVPVATSGGLLSLAARGLPMSIAAAVGMIALFGVATLNGAVLLGAAERLRDQGEGAIEAARLAAAERFRPVLTTALVAAVGFVPMALATGSGAEVQRPLATVVIGGLVTSTLLTLVLLPALYAWASRRGGAKVDVATGARVDEVHA
jgi:cobalt-zinc-cadmium resistance protein CzcA